METKELSNLNAEDIDIDELTQHLSQLVLTRTEKEIGDRQHLLIQKKDYLKKSKELIKPLKQEYDSLVSNLSKEKQLSRVLSIIDTLKKEGKLVGKNKITVRDVLLKLDKMDFEKLRKLEEKLSIYLPDKYINGKQFK